MSKNWMELPYWETQEIFKWWWRGAGEDVRKEIINELNKIPVPSSEVYKCDSRFSTDYCNNQYLCGHYHVYAWVSKKCRITYIGYGSSYRAATLHGRNESFRSESDINEMKVFILCANVNERDAQDIETLCIWRAMLSGWSLTNKSKTLTQHQLLELRADKEKSKVNEYYQRLIDDYPEVVESYDRLNSYCLDMVLSEDSELPHDVRFKTTNPQEKLKYVKHMWTIDGEAKPANEWCKHYGVALSRANMLIDRYGCTPKEALTFPRLPKELCRKKKDIGEWWHENGYCPGTDQTSYVTPREEWGDEYAMYGE